MVLIEALEASGDYPISIGGEPTTLKPPAEGRQVIEFPRFDPLTLTRNEWLGLPDARSKKDALVSLRKKGYRPEYAMKARELFPEGYSFPLSEIEKRVFTAMTNVMASMDEVSLSNKHVLAEHLHDISGDDAVQILRQEAETRIANGNFWYMRHEVGGYELNRLIAKEIEDHVEAEQKRDEVKMHAFLDMSLTLGRFGIPMLEQDHAELERLTGEYEERQNAIQEYWRAEREKGYQSLKPL